MTGAGDLFSNPQPVTEKPSALSLSGRCGVSPAEGVGRDRGLGRRGRLSPPAMSVSAAWLALIPKAAKEPAVEGDRCSAAEASSASDPGVSLLPIANDPLKINQLISRLL